MTSTAEKIDVNVKTLVHAVIMCAIMFGFRYVPAPGTVTEYGMAVAGVFLALVYGWSFIGILWPSLLGLFGLAFAGYGTVEQVALAMMNNSTVFMMLVGSLAFMALMQSKAADYIMAKIIGSSIAQKSPMYTVMIIFAASLLINSFGGTMIFYFGIFPIMVATLKKCGYQAGERFNIMFLTGFMATIQLGMCFRPFIGWGLMTVGTMQQLTQTGISYGLYMVVMAVIYVVFIITYPFFMKICKCDFDKLGNVNIAEAFGMDKEQKMTLTQKIVLIAMGIFLLVVIVGSIAGKSLGVLYTYYSMIGVAGMMVLFWIAMTVIQVDGKPMLDIREASKMFGWDMLFLVAIALLISTVLTSQETGISGWLASLVGPLFAGKSPIMFLVMLAVVTCILTNIANNIAICFIMMNLVASMYLNGMPVDIMVSAIIISLCSVMAFLTPASSMPGAMLHACEMCTPKALYQLMPFILLYMIALFLVVLIPISIVF